MNNKETLFYIQLKSTEWIDSLLPIKSELIDIIKKIGNHKEEIYIIGNGGSASTASHFAEDLTNVGKRAQALLDSAMLTMCANDFGYASVFSNQLLNKRGILITFSVSGTSFNIFKATEEFRGTVINFTGKLNNKNSKSNTLNYEVNSYNFGAVESAHLFLVHLIIEELKTWK